MKHVSGNIEVAGEAEVRVPTRRALAKQQTRAKVLAAARHLFSEAGYEGATIRDIAAEAGMSTGAVFANFADKSDLFREIMIADMESLVEAMRDGVSRGRGVDDTLLKLYALYKQATTGDVNTKRPGAMDFVGRAKWDAWDGHKGQTTDQAMQNYIDLVNSLKG